MLVRIFNLTRGEEREVFFSLVLHRSASQDACLRSGAACGGVSQLSWASLAVHPLCPRLPEVGCRPPDDKVGARLSAGGSSGSATRVALRV